MNVRPVSIEIFKTCSSCKQEKNIFLFFKRNRSKDGYECICKECHKNKQRSKKYKQTWNSWNLSISGTATRLINKAKQRNKKLKLPFDIDREWIINKLSKGKCEITELPFIFTNGRTPWTPSLDRIVPNKGYTKDNVHVVIWLYNAAKSSYTHADVLLLAKSLISKEK